MSSHSTASRVELTESYREWGRPERRHSVRLALVTWPIVICLGATVAAAACLIGDCSNSKKLAATDARETRVGHTGTVQSVAFRNIPSYVLTESLPVNTYRGATDVALVYGGAMYATEIGRAHV